MAGAAAAATGAALRGRDVRPASTMGARPCPSATRAEGGEAPREAAAAVAIRRTERELGWGREAAEGTRCVPGRGGGGLFCFFLERVALFLEKGIFT